MGKLSAQVEKKWVLKYLLQENIFCPHKRNNSDSIEMNGDH